MIDLNISGLYPWEFDFFHYEKKKKRACSEEIQRFLSLTTICSSGINQFGSSLEFSLFLIVKVYLHRQKAKSILFSLLKN